MLLAAVLLLMLGYIRTRTDRCVQLCQQVGKIVASDSGEAVVEIGEGDGAR